MRNFKNVKKGGEIPRENTPIITGNENNIKEIYGESEDIVIDKTIIKDNIFILPCLQERRRSGIFSTRFEKEQEASIMNDKENQELSSRSSKLFNKVWQGNSNLENILPDDMRESLVCPSFESLAFDKFTECKDLNTVQKWELLINWVLSQEKTEEGGTYILVTHHNRMRGDDSKDNQALLPFITEKSECNAYANNFCLRIHINTDNDEPSINFEIAFSGFPDKGNFPEDCEKIECEQLRCKNSRMKIGGGDYKYCCDNLKSSINTEIIKNLLKSYAEGGNLVGKNIVIYLIRHGNSLHNKPLESSERLDSSLTYLGIYQGFLLGKYLKEYYPNDFNNKTICLGSSFLSRAQLTALTILNSIKNFTEDNPKLKNDYNLLIKNALRRCKNYLWINSKKLKNINGIKLNMPSESVFTGYAPLDNVKDITLLQRDPYYVPEAFKYFIDDLLKDYNLIGVPQGGNKTKRKKHKKRNSKKKCLI